MAGRVDSGTEAQQGFPGEGGDQGAIPGEHVTAAEAASVCHDRTGAMQQQPVIGAEKAMETHRG